jgi:hypothetical protein
MMRMPYKKHAKYLRTWGRLRFFEFKAQELNIKDC